MRSEGPRSGAYRAALKCLRTLRDWVDQERKELQNRDLLEILAEQWAQQGRPRLSGLATRRQLRDFGRVKGAEDPAPAYLRASRWHGRLVYGLGTFVLVGVLGILHEWWLASKDWSYAQELVFLRAWVGDIEEPELVSIDAGSFTMGRRAMVVPGRRRKAVTAAGV